MKKTSRVLAILLALALIVGMGPFSTKDVSAATDESYMLEAYGRSADRGNIYDAEQWRGSVCNCCSNAM